MLELAITPECFVICFDN